MNKSIVCLNDIIAMDSARYATETKSGMRRELRQRLRTCNALKSVFGDVKVAVELNPCGTVNNGSFYESVLKALLTLNALEYYTSSSRTEIDLSKDLIAHYGARLGLDNNCDYEIKTSMCNESNELTQTDNVIIINYHGVMLLTSDDIKSLTDSDFRKGTRRLKNSVVKGKHLELLETLLGF